MPFKTEKAHQRATIGLTVAVVLIAMLGYLLIVNLDRINTGAEQRMDRLEERLNRMPAQGYQAPSRP